MTVLFLIVAFSTGLLWAHVLTKYEDKKWAKIEHQREERDAEFRRIIRIIEEG